MKIIPRDSPKIGHPSPLDSFFDISPFACNGFAEAKQNMTNREYPRAALSGLLEKYNRLVGNDQAALAHVARLKDPNACCVVTGQQLGFMGGPAYTILKGVSCLLAARKADAIPIFWLATDDHDIAEIDHAYLLDNFGNLKNHRLAFPKDGTPVEDLCLKKNHLPAIELFLEKANLAFDVKKCFEDNCSYALTMAKLLAKIFSGTGLVFLEPRLLRELAAPFFKDEILKREALQSALSETTNRYLEAGGRPLIQISEHPNLFLKDREGARRKIKWTGGTSYVAGQQHFTESALLSLIDKQPDLFSSNVASRPILQSLLIPTLSYIGGPAELAYHRQLKDYYHVYGLKMPWILPRLSAVMIPPYAQEWLEKCRLQPWTDVPHHWPEVFPDLVEGVQELQSSWSDRANSLFQNDLPSASIEKYVQHYVSNMKKKIFKKRLKRKAVPPHALHYLKNLFHPHGKPQERVLNWFTFQSHAKESLVQELLKQADWKHRGCLYCLIQ